MFYHKETHVLHVWPVVVNHESRRLFSGIKVLVPGKYRNTKRITFLPINALILNDRVAVAGYHVFCLFVAMPVSALIFFQTDSPQTVYRLSELENRWQP